MAIEKMQKTFFIISSTVALGVGAYAAYRFWKRREFKSIDEGFEDVSKIDETPEKILVLGLERSGKTTLITQITTGLVNETEIQSTDDFHVSNLYHGNKIISIWDVGGSEKVRKSWINFIQDTDLLMFVVDSTDSNQFLTAVKELKGLAGDDRLKNVPFLIIASKQDLPGALPPKKLAEALDIASILPSKHKITVLGTQIDYGQIHHSVMVVKKTIFDMI